MAIEHSDIVDGERHPPIGIDAATVHEMYVADGAGGGSWQRSGMSDHGEMTITNNATATAITAAVDATLNTDSDYVKITVGWAGPHVHGVTFSIDKLICAVAGHYEVAFWSSIKIPLNNNFIGIKYAINDSTPYSLQKMVSQSATTSDYRTMAGHGGVDLSAGDTVSIYMAASKTDNLVIEEAGMSLHLVHEL